MKKSVIILFLLLISIIYSYPQEISGSKKIVIEESVVKYEPIYTYEDSIGPNISPYCLTKGSYKLRFLIYSEGSILSKLVVGLWDIFSFGIIEDIEGIIGNNKVILSIPLVNLKLNLINEWNGFSISLAIDNYSLGNSGKAFNPDYYSRNLYGLHIPMAIRYKSIFNYSDLVFGLKIPLLPINDVDIINSSLYVSTYLKPSEYITISGGIDNLFPTPQRITNSSIFGEVRFSPTRSLSISILLNYSFLPSFERTIKIEYIDNIF
ncbi:MAG: hypothetical protein ACP5QP_06280 [Brevinematia bacterium]